MNTAVMIDSEGDIVLDSAGRIKTVGGTQKIIQDLSIILWSVKGSCPFDTGFGIDDLSEFHGDSRKLIRTAVRSALLQHDSVEDVKDTQVTLSGRTATITTTVVITGGTEITMEATV